ncbi:MAG: YbaB/EbfC family nucleoid-associated protein [Acidobacteriaceae bacterium]
MELDMNKMQEMLAQAQEMQQTMDLRLAETVVEAETGGGAVKARMNGKKELLSLTIAPSAASAAASDLTLLEDLIVAAVNACARKADEASKSNAASMLGGLGLPGF